MFLGIFQHCNVRTPRWLGYFVQRPESHTVHHGKGLHYYNFSDLPVFDVLLGTFRNPPGYEMETGFYLGASAAHRRHAPVERRQRSKRGANGVSRVEEMRSWSGRETGRATDRSAKQGRSARIVRNRASRPRS